jgi:hypothetical protein
MAICVRPIDRVSDHQELLALLEANLPAIPHARRFPWLYHENPDGPAWSWFVQEKATGQIVGTASVFPHALWVGGESRLCGQVGDFAISPKYRSLGPNLLLHRATFELVDRGTLSFCYDCTANEKGMATFRRLGMQAQCAVERHAFPLRADRQLAKVRGLSILAPAVNALLRMQRPRKSTASGLEISEHTGAFGEEFTHLDRALCNPETIRVRRTAEVLNWRYRKDPLQKYQVLTARRSGELRAFAVFYVKGPEVMIADLFGMEQPDAGVALLAAVAERCEMQCETIHAFLAAGSEMAGVHVNAGFRPRPSPTQVVAYAKPGSEVSEFLQDSRRWTFSAVDIWA